jgi:preprotein translocase subunit SecE
MKAIKRYIRQVIKELRKVSWPSKEQTINKTILVLVVSSLVAAYISGADLLLAGIMKLLLQ